jgi:hypothetical protein
MIEQIRNGLHPLDLMSAQRSSPISEFSRELTRDYLTHIHFYQRGEDSVKFIVVRGRK